MSSSMRCRSALTGRSTDRAAAGKPCGIMVKREHGDYNDRCPGHCQQKGTAIPTATRMSSMTAMFARLRWAAAGSAGSSLDKCGSGATSVLAMPRHQDEWRRTCTPANDVVLLRSPQDGERTLPRAHEHERVHASLGWNIKPA